MDNLYSSVLYPFQDQVLQIILNLDTKFYLTGGTAASRGYLNHRYSDDLDLFVNDDDHFNLWVDRTTQALQGARLGDLEILAREERFALINIIQPDLELKLEFINDVPAHVGEITNHQVLGKLDSAENILANKVTAILAREEPKDLADIWGFCTLMNLSLSDAITNAESKAAGIFPPDLARVFLTTNEDDWKVIRWINKPEVNEFIADMHILGENLIHIQ
jgi:hypothetical protein